MNVLKASGGGSLNEPDIIKALFDELMLTPLQPFRRLGIKLNAPTQPAVTRQVRDFRAPDLGAAGWGL